MIGDSFQRVGLLIVIVGGVYHLEGVITGIYSGMAGYSEIILLFGTIVGLIGAGISIRDKKEQAD
jgi:hypothetical protein